MEQGILISDRSGVGRTPILLAILVMAIVAITAIGLAIIYNPSNNPSEPDAPGGLHATTGDHLVMLSWEEPADNGAEITSYKVYRGTSPGDVQFSIWLGLVLTYNDTNVVNGDTYYYAVSAVNRVGEGEVSETISVTIPAIPSAPRDLSTTLEYTQVTLTWSPPSDDGGAPIIGYKVFRSGISGEYESQPYATVTSLYFIDNLQGVTGVRFYIVKAYNRAGESPSSNEATALAVTETPTITMTYQKTGALEYTFTVVGVSANGIQWADITPVISGAAGATFAVDGTPTLVGAGDTMTFTYVTAGSYSLILKFDPTGSAAYSLSLTAM